MIDKPSEFPLFVYRWLHRHALYDWFYIVIAILFTMMSMSLPSLIYLLAWITAFMQIRSTHSRREDKLTLPWRGLLCFSLVHLASKDVIQGLVINWRLSRVLEQIVGLTDVEENWQFLSKVIAIVHAFTIPFRQNWTSTEESLRASEVSQSYMMLPREPLDIPTHEGLPAALNRNASKLGWLAIAILALKLHSIWGIAFLQASCIALIVSAFPAMNEKLDTKVIVMLLGVNIVGQYVCLVLPVHSDLVFRLTGWDTSPTLESPVAVMFPHILTMFLFVWTNRNEATSSGGVNAHQRHYNLLSARVLVLLRYMSNLATNFALAWFTFTSVDAAHFPFFILLLSVLVYPSYFRLRAMIPLCAIFVFAISYVFSAVGNATSMNLGAFLGSKLQHSPNDPCLLALITMSLLEWHVSRSQELAAFDSSEAVEPPQGCLQQTLSFIAMLFSLLDDALRSYGPVVSDLAVVIVCSLGSVSLFYGVLLVQSLVHIVVSVSFAPSHSRILIRTWWITAPISFFAVLCMYAFQFAAIHIPLSRSLGPQILRLAGLRVVSKGNDLESYMLPMVLLCSLSLHVLRHQHREPQAHSISRSSLLEPFISRITVNESGSGDDDDPQSSSSRPITARLLVSAVLRRFVAPHARKLSVLLLFAVSILKPTLIAASDMLFSYTFLLFKSGGEIVFVLFCSVVILTNYVYQFVYSLFSDPTQQLLQWVGVDHPLSIGYSVMALLAVLLQIVSKNVQRQHEIASETDDDSTPEWTIDTIVDTISRGNSFEITLSVVVAVSLYERNLWSSINLIIVGVCMSLSRSRVRRYWKVAVWWWTLVLWVRYVLASAQFRPTSPSQSWSWPWSSWPEPLQRWVGVGTPHFPEFLFEFLVLFVGVIQMQLFQTDMEESVASDALAPNEPAHPQEQEADNDHLDIENPTSSTVSGWQQTFIPWKVGVLKSLSTLGLPLVFIFAAGALSGVSPNPRSASALIYCCTSLYLLHTSTLPHPRGNAVWLSLGCANIFILLTKVMLSSPLLDSARPRIHHLFGLEVNRVWGSDVIVFILVLVQRRVHELGLFSSVRLYDKEQLHRHLRQSRNIGLKHWKQRKLALLALLRSYILRQRRYIERWGLRGGTRMDRERSILARLSKVGIIKVHDDIGSVEELLEQVRNLIPSLTAPVLTV